MNKVVARFADGRKIKVVFKDGEVLAGTTTGYQPGRPAFLCARRCRF